MILARLTKFRSLVEELKLDAFLVTFPPHLRYLSGFTGSSGLGFVGRRRCMLFTDSRYSFQASREAKSWDVVITDGGDSFAQLGKLRKLKPGMRIGFDGNTMVFAEYRRLRKIFPEVKFLPVSEAIDRIAAVKDATEIAAIRRAVTITDHVFAEVIQFLRPGVKELDISAEISYRQRKHGATEDAFPTIVASGERGALPHGSASEKVLRRGELVTLDFGCVVDGYHSDMTRTVSLGAPSGEAKAMYRAVLEAQLRAIEAARSGMKAKDLDAVARGSIKAAGYERYFRHSLGHGIGLRIHEAPRLSVLSTATLQSGNVVTVEPGVYIPRVGGVRIEDDIIIMDGHCEVLNRSPKELLIL